MKNLKQTSDRNITINFSKIQNKELTKTTKNDFDFKLLLNFNHQKIEGDPQEENEDDNMIEQLLEEKYSLLNQVLQGVISKDETETLKTKYIKISSGEQSYEHCMEIKDAVNNNENDSDRKSSSSKNSKASTGDESNNADIKHYYCYNDEKNLLDYVLVGNNYFEVVDSF